MKLALRRSLKAKMTLAVLLMAVTTFAVGGLLALTYFETTLKQNIADQQFVLVSRIARSIDNHIRQAQRIILETAEPLPPSVTKDPERAQAFLDQHLGAATRLIFDNGIFLFDAEGRLVAEHPYIPGRQGRDYSFRSYFRRTMEERRPIISDPYFSSQPHHHPAINFTAPIRESDGTIVAVLAGSLDLTGENFFGDLRNVVLGRTGYLYLYNDDRTIIMHPDPERILAKDVPPGINVLFDRAREGFEGTGETINSRGLHALASFKHLSTVDWILGANYPVEEAFAPVARARENFFYGLAAVLALTSLTVWFLMAYLTAPLHQLISHFGNISSGGDFQEKLPVRTRDEIGLLTAAFNEMTEQLSAQRQLCYQQVDFLQNLIDTLPNPVYYKDARNRYLGCNVAFERVHGIGREHLVGKTSMESGVPVPELDVADAALLAQGENSCTILDLSLVYSDGTVHDLILYQAAFQNRGGEPYGMVGTLVDITQRKSIELALAEQREFTENLLQNSAVPCFVIDANHQVLIWTRACEELTGVDAGEVLGTSEHWRAFYMEPRPCLADLILEEDMERVLDLYTIFSESPLIPEGAQAEGWFQLNGKAKYLRFEAAPIRDSSGNLIAAVETLQDLTSLKQKENALREGEANYRALVERSPDAIVVHRREKVIFVNQAAADLFGINRREDAVGIEIMKLVHPDFRQIVRQRTESIETAREQNPYEEERLQRLDGSGFMAEVASSRVFHGGEWAVQTIVRDITERKELERKIWRQANFDSLTGLPNRHLFYDRLQHGLDRAQREGYLVALLFVDLDRFKEVNDTLGHAAGDRLLQEVADRLTAVMRKTDTVARMGGDEFTVIMPRIGDPDAAEIVARRIIERLSEPCELPGGTRKISASVGIAIFPRDGEDPEMLLSRADRAMYGAKKGGRGDFRQYRKEDEEVDQVGSGSG